MSTRSHGLLRSKRATRVIASILAVGMVAAFVSSYLAQAGLPMVGVAVAVLLVLGVPVLVARRANREDR